MFALKTHRIWVPPLQMKKKKTFYMATWTCNVGIGNEGSAQGWKCVLDRGHKEICTWESFGIPKSNSVSPGVLDAYLSGVQCRTLPRVASNTPKT